MSGLNPFRHRKPEDATGQSSASPINSNFPFPVLPPAAAPVTNLATISNPSSAPSHRRLSSDHDDSASSDDQSAVNPFHPDSSLSDNDTEEESGEAGRWSSSRLPRDNSHRVSVDAAAQNPHHVQSSYRTAITPGVASDTGTGKDESGTARTQENDPLPDTSMGARPYPPPHTFRTAHSGSRSASNSSADGSRYSVSGHQTMRTDTGRPLVNRSTSEVDGEPRMHAVRSGNKEKKPPPPPKSHHGKLISNHAPAPRPRPRPLSYTASMNSLDYVPSFGASPEIPLSPSPGMSSQRSQSSAQPTTDYFSSVPKIDEPQSAESLRRSQSQHKQPPAPPLSRRHSQMRRSKSTASKINPSRLTLPADYQFNTPSLPSPGSKSLTSSLHLDSNYNTPQPGDTPFIFPSAKENPINAATTPAEEKPDSVSPTSVGATSIKSSKRSSQSSSLTPSPMPPPPPPPRRVRGSSKGSSDSTRPAVLNQEKKAGPEDDLFPHRSNASDILADLSRLQKEVDDLRGHYESRKVGH